MRRHLAVAAGVIGALVVLVAVVAVLSGGSTDEGTTDGPVIAVDGWNAYPAAEVTGPLKLVDGCLLIGDSVVFWADRTSWDAEDQAVVFDGHSTVRVGQEFSGGGGYFDRGDLDGLDGLDVDAVKDCMDRTGSEGAVVATP